MNDKTLGSWVRRFLLEHLISERNCSLNTQRSYRDTLRLFLHFVAKAVHRPIDRLRVDDISADMVRAFLRDMEQDRRCGPATRNQRLAAIHSFAHFIACHWPEQIQWCAEIRNIPSKKTPHRIVNYLEKEEMDAILKTPDRSKELGQRDYALLLFLYNTAARADEAAHVQVIDLRLGHAKGRDSSSVKIHGKGNKDRECPLWNITADALRPLLKGGSQDGYVFLNRRGEALTRYGIHALVGRYAAKAEESMPSLGRKRVSPHTIRHTAAMHLLRSGVDINTIRAWLGHVSLATTNIYAEADLQMKANAMGALEIGDKEGKKPWREKTGLEAFFGSIR